MDHDRVTTHALRVVALLGAFSFPLTALVGCAEVPPAAVKKIEAAKTKADHEELAAYYEQEAKAAQAKAEQHLDQARRYRKGAPFVYPRATATALIEHCDSIANKYKEIADESAKLAKTHRDLAVKTRE